MNVQQWSGDLISKDEEDIGLACIRGEGWWRRGGGSSGNWRAVKAIHLEACEACNCSHDGVSLGLLRSSLCRDLEGQRSAMYL